MRNAKRRAAEATLTDSINDSTLVIPVDPSNLEVADFLNIGDEQMGPIATVGVSSVTLQPGGRGYGPTDAAAHGRNAKVYVVAVAEQFPESADFNICDYGAVSGSDSSTAINAALTAAAARAAIIGRQVAVFIPCGTFILDAVLEIPANVKLFGRGNSSILKVKSAFPTSHPIVNKVTTGFTNVTLCDFAIDGNAAGQSGDQTTNGSPNELLFMSSASGTPGSDVLIERIYAHDSYRLGIVMQNIQGGAIRHCRVESNGRDGITLFDACKRITIASNRVKGCSDDHIAVDGQSAQADNIAITGNVITGPGARSLGKGIRVQGARNVTVTGNTIDSVSEDGIRVNDWDTIATANIAITGNTIRNTGSGGSGSKVGILVICGYASYPPSRSGYATITDVTIANNTIESAGGNGIELRSDHADEEFNRVKVIGNTVSTSGGEGITVTSNSTFKVGDLHIAENTVHLSAGHGIFVNSTALRFKVNDNVCFNNGTGGSNTMGIRVVTGATAATVTGNFCYETRTGGSRTQVTGIQVNASTSTGIRASNNLAVNNTTTQWSYQNFSGSVTFEGFFGTAQSQVKPTVTGSRGSNAALQSLLTGLASLGLITDSSS